MLAAVLLVSLAGGRGYCAEGGAAGSDEKAGTITSADKPAGLTAEQKRTLAHHLAKWWLPILLLLIIFVVVLMVVTRAMKLWVLGRGRPVKFDPVDDVWSQAKDKQEGPRKKTDK